MKNVILVQHPLLTHCLTIVRDKHTDSETFRKNSAIISQIMIMEAMRSLTVHSKKTETPLGFSEGGEIDRSIVFLPVLRAGLTMLFPAKEFLPWAPVGFIGLERDEKTAVAREYYQKFPPDISSKHVLILDPMLATGNSLVSTIDVLKNMKVQSASVVCVVAAPEGLRRLQETHPWVPVYTAAMDDHLDESKYIVPGLGDFGDRYFGT